jgi:hypothetical protein
MFFFGITGVRMQKEAKQTKNQNNIIPLKIPPVNTLVNN